jgi:hypothetical protein
MPPPNDDDGPCEKARESQRDRHDRTGAAKIQRMR